MNTYHAALILAQSPLDGFITIPAPLIAIIAGLSCLGGLLYLARRLSSNKDELRSEQERKTKQR